MVVLFFESLCVVCCVFAAVTLKRAARTVGEVNFRVTQLLAGNLPKPPHPYDCPHCGSRFKQTLWKLEEGEKGFCGRCLVWHQITPPIALPRYGETL